eukprot:CAMPEP_0175872994 /NCGR_PEP_ID=MMETSP0107_2-20121207/38053_1 /TAXON_ID=195067 ORGANISM="Goniomonas pacifica, Strain CCMP1869" /NCGR_SAMPLE_ID=MMETSP0107_2 /ASSEMBLY_ACC=CAM_ASM_000203 /LENGTH=85 /DNA_ID=CAMNT_0017191653 /DNA_START=34 /DNA_END=291 /DNA_ORIENTATION=-
MPMALRSWPAVPGCLAKVITLNVLTAYLPSRLTNMCSGSFQVMHIAREFIRCTSRGSLSGLVLTSHTSLSSMAAPGLPSTSASSL